MNRPRKCDWCGEEIGGADVRVKLPVMWDGPAMTYHANCYVQVYEDDCRGWLAELDADREVDTFAVISSVTTGASPDEPPANEAVSEDKKADTNADTDPAPDSSTGADPDPTPEQAAAADDMDAQGPPPCGGYVMRSERKAQLCPVCGGRGAVPSAAYGNSTACNILSPCHGCGGTGWVAV